jgi:hypothetical protein
MNARHQPTADTFTGTVGSSCAQQPNESGLQTRNDLAHGPSAAGVTTNSLQARIQPTHSPPPWRPPSRPSQPEYRQAMEDTMGRMDRKLLMVVSCLALATTTTVVTIAAPAPAITIAGQTGQRKALYQSELEQNLLLRTQLGYGLIAAYGPLRMPPG